MEIIWGYRTHKRIRQFDWVHPKIVHISPYICERKIRERLEINKLRTINGKDKILEVGIETMVTTSQRILENLFS